MKQVIVIHGGTTFENYDEYLEFLSSKPLNIDRFTYKPMWKELLQENLGGDYQVLLPAMPNKTNARYNEWKLWFEHFSSLFTNGCILVGHSLGAVFLAKYLSEETLPIKVDATILIATPFDDDSVEDLTDFKITSLNENLSNQAGELVFYNGLDDPVISERDLKKYQDALPSAEFNIIPAPDHFMRVEFPELIERIKRI